MVINYKNKSEGFVPTTNIPNFSSEDGSLDCPKEMFLLPSFNWTWTSDWMTVNDSEDVFQF